MSDSKPNNSSSDPIDDLNYAIDRDLLLDQYGHSIERAVRAGLALPSDFEELRFRVERQRNKEALHEHVPFRRTRFGNSGVLIGRDHQGKEVRYDLLSSAVHMCGVGSTGSAKTSYFYALLAELIKARPHDPVGMLIVDLYKNEWRALHRVAQEAGRELAVLKSRELRYNALEPDGLEPHQHLQSAVSMLSRTLGLSERASILLKSSIAELYQRHGVLHGEYENCPTLFDAYEHIRGADANAQAKASLLDRLGGLLLALGPALAYRRGWRPSMLLDRLVVLELAGSSNTVRQWLPNSILSGLFSSQIARGACNSSLRHLTLIEDGQRFIAGDGLDRNDAPIADVLGTIRSAGLALALIFQSIAPIPPAILANLSYRISGTPGSYADLRRLQHETGMTQEQASWVNEHLKPGRYLCHIAGSPWRHPFILETPRPRLVMPSEEERLRSRAALDDLPVISAEEYRNWSPSGSKVIVREVAALEPKPLAHPEIQLSAKEHRLLEAVIDTPHQPVSVYPRRAHLSPRDAKRARERLIELDFIRATKVALNQRGRQPLLLESTPTGTAYLKKHSGAVGSGTGS